MLLSTETAAYHFPGTCDFSAYANPLVCTEQHNNVTTGGIFPSITHEGLYKATGDIAVFMKPLYEADPELLQLQVMFYNGGAGSTLKFAAGPVAPLKHTYVSKGCDWITGLTNPHTGKAFGSLEDEAKCRTAGDVESQDYNSMETGTAEFILTYGPSPAKTLTALDNISSGVAWEGPLLASDNATVVLRAGKAIYDRKTNELIGFATADVLETFLSEYLTNRVLNVDSNVYVARYDTGCIISVSPNADYGIFEKLPKYEEIKEEMDRQLESYMNELRSTRPDNQQYLDQPIFLAPLASGDIITASFLPVPPKQFDGAERYRPVAFVVQRMPVDVFHVVNHVETEIDTDVRKALCFSVAMGVGGFILVMAILGGMSSILTSPLNFITKVASQVINNVLTDVKGALNDSNDRQGLSDGCPANLARDSVNDYNISRCTPKTEVNLLVKEFQRMIQGFSGVGASNVAEPPMVQIKNELVWHSDFAKLYDPAGLSKKSFRWTSISTEASESIQRERRHRMLGIFGVYEWSW